MLREKAAEIEEARLHPSSRDGAAQHHRKLSEMSEINQGEEADK